MDLAATSIRDALHHFVVRQPGQWLLTPLPAADPVPVPAEVVVELVSGSEVPPPVVVGVSLDGVTPFGADDEVEAAWMFAGLVTSAGILVEAVSVGPALLDEVDVRLITAIVAPTRAAELDDLAEGADQVRRRLRRLVMLGCLRHVQAG